MKTISINMKHRSIFAAGTIAILSAVLMFSAFSVPQVEAYGGPASISGTYLLTQADGFLQLLTLIDDGNAFSQNSGQFGPSTTFGNQQGRWEFTGRGKITIRTLDFTYNPATGFTGFGRSLFTAKFDKEGKLTGEVLVEIFPPNADPLDLSPSNQPINTFGPTAFTGRRLTVNSE